MKLHIQTSPHSLERLWGEMELFIVYLLQPVVHDIAESLSHKKADADDQQEAADDPDRTGTVGSPGHVCRCCHTEAGWRGWEMKDAL